MATGARVQVNLVGRAVALQFQGRVDLATQLKGRGAVRARAAQHQWRQRIAGARLGAIELHIHGRPQGRLAKLKAPILCQQLQDVQVIAVLGCAAALPGAHQPVSLALTVTLQAHIRTQEHQSRDRDAANQQRPEPHAHIQSLGAGHDRLLRPGSIAQAQALGVHFQGKEIHVEFAVNAKLAVRCVGHHALEGPLGPVPIKQQHPQAQDQHCHCAGCPCRVCPQMP